MCMQETPCKKISKWRYFTSGADNMLYINNHEELQK